MIEKKLRLGAIIFFLLLHIYGLASTFPGRDTKIVHVFRKRIEQLVGSRKVPSMAVAVACNGEIIWEEGFGYADCEKKIRATAHTRYALASISKPPTATGLMILQERGLISLDSPINNYLGEAKIRARVGSAAQATVRRVACHTSGLPLHSRRFYDGNPHPLPTMDETIRRYGNLVTAPGERYQYSNLGYGLLGDVISRVSGKSYADFMHEEVFAPLGLGHTSVHVEHVLEDDPAVKYTPDGWVVPPCDSDSPGASGIYSSVHDLIRFGMFHLKNGLTDQKAIITAATIDAMHKPSPETGPTRVWERGGSGCGRDLFTPTRGRFPLSLKFMNLAVYTPRWTTNLALFLKMCATETISLIS
jgi:CubicO group peptidase (beta-lactamase class C family)